MFGETFVVQDRRRLIGGGSTDREGLIASIRVTADQGYERFSFEPIATRGERVVLLHINAHGSHGYDGPALGVIEIDAAGRFVQWVVFDLDDVDAAFEELDRRSLRVAKRLTKMRSLACSSPHTTRASGASSGR